MVSEQPHVDQSGGADGPNTGFRFKGLGFRRARLQSRQEGQDLGQFAGHFVVGGAPGLAVAEHSLELLQGGHHLELDIRHQLPIRGREVLACAANPKP